MQGFERPAGFDAVRVAAPGLVDPDSIFGFLEAHRADLFPPRSLDDMFADPIRGGKPSVPGPVVLAALVLQGLLGVSDREVVERLTYDLRWKAACGVGVGEKGCFHPTVLVYWRNRIACSARPDRIGDAVRAVIAQCGAVRGKQRRVVDSTVVDDAVARQDTATLLVWQIARIAELCPRLGNQIMGLPGGVWYRHRSKPEIDWGSKSAKDELVSILVEDAKQVAGWVGSVAASLDVDDPARARLEDEAGLMFVLAGQDVEPAPGSDGTDGRWRIAERTAKDRIISIVDRETRHLRKTGKNKHDGFKAHVEVEPDTGLILATAVSSGCGDGSSDADNGVKLLRTDPAVASGVITQVLGDSAYDSAGFLEAADELKIEPVVKARPLTVAIPGGYSLDDFTLNQDTNTITCPAGHEATRSPKGRAKFTPWCATCPLRPSCTKAKKGRIVVIGPPQLRQREHRRRVGDPVFTATLKQHRPMVERSLAWLCRPGRRTPYRGITKTAAWWALRAAAINLKRLLNLGLQHSQAGYWILNPVT